MSKDKNWINISKSVSEFSKANRRKVGAVIVSKNGIVLGTGYNGTPTGVDNSCEDENDVTHEYVIHAELNAIFNASTNDLEGSTIYITDEPCIKCAAAILQKKISRVVYERPYHNQDGQKLLTKHNVKVEQIFI